MKGINFSCQGESHKAINKVCQDFSFSKISDHLSIAIVCDGHGGDRYFRSDVGAKIATDTTVECVQSFVDNVQSDIFVGKTFTAIGTIEAESLKKNTEKENLQDKYMRQLFSAIIYKWNIRILDHANTNPLTENEKETLKVDIITDFEARKSIEKTYGCTLMCYVQTDDFWFAFHIGDGKCVILRDSGEWLEPVPWDDNCFLNKTTSICDNSALAEFRYCYEGDGKFPVAVFLASDGLDDSFGEIDNQINFYIQIIKSINISSAEAETEIYKTLPELSRIGSKDDMSIACVYDEKKLPEMQRTLICWQRDNILQGIIKLNMKIESLVSELDKYKNTVIDSLTENEKICLKNNLTEVKRLYDSKRVLATNYDRLSNELGATEECYDDETGFVYDDSSFL